MLKVDQAWIKAIYPSNAKESLNKSSKCNTVSFLSSINSIKDVEHWTSAYCLKINAIDDWLERIEIPIKKVEFQINDISQYDKL